MTNTKKTKTDADRFKELVDSLNSLKLLTSQAEQHRYLFRDIARNLRALIIRKKSKNFKPLLLDLASKREYSLCVYVMDLKIQEQLDKENPDIVISNFSGLMMLEPNEHPAFNTALELSEALEKVMVDKVFRMDDFISIKELLEQFGDKEAAHFDLEIPSDLCTYEGTGSKIKMVVLIHVNKFLNEWLKLLLHLARDFVPQSAPLRAVVDGRGTSEYFIYGGSIQPILTA